MRIEIISGSPRQNSVTVRVAKFLFQHLQNLGIDVGLVDMRDHKLGMIQKVITSPAEAPEALKTLAERMFAANAYIIVTPEYNGSYSPAMQNLFDHFPKQHHKAFGIVTASPGALGGIRAAMQLQQFIIALFGIPSPYMMVTPQVDKKFDENAQLTDSSFQKSIDLFVKEFLWLAELVEENEKVGV